LLVQAGSLAGLALIVYLLAPRDSKPAGDEADPA
jgi:hypothetical protein